MTEEEILTSDAELLKLVKGGAFFEFCLCFALKKGFRNAMKETGEVAFSVGDYSVKFDKEEMCFTLIHKVYFARIIAAYYGQSVFIGNNEDEVIADLLAELQKELSIDASTEKK